MPLLSSISSQAARISDLTEQISQLEGRADDLHDVGLQRALSDANVKSNPMAFFVGNEIYDHLEKVVDRFDDVANVMHGIVIEHVLSTFAVTSPIAQRLATDMNAAALALPSWSG